VNAYDPRLHEQQQKLEALEAQVARNEKIARITVIVGIILAVVALGVLLDHHLGGQWSPRSLSGFIP
jgi:hypothetical protein